MSTVQQNSAWTPIRVSGASAKDRAANGTTSASAKLHRLATVRKQQGLSLRSAARQMGVDIRSVREQEAETSDLRLSDLYTWQQILGVPLAELLEDPGTPLSRPVMERARMVRIMKTVKALVENAKNSSTKRLAETLIGQLIEVMPELEEVGPWHSVGQRRSLEEFGRAAERSLSDDLFRSDRF